MSVPDDYKAIAKRLAEIQHRSGTHSSAPPPLALGPSPFPDQAVAHGSVEHPCCPAHDSALVHPDGSRTCGYAPIGCIMDDDMSAREVRKITSRGDWLLWRQQDITASRVAALFDAHPHLSREQLANNLRGASQGDSPAMRAGRILEPGVIVALQEEYPDWQITKATTYHRLPDIRLGCTPDYWLGDDGLIQCKTVSPEEWEKWQGKPPLAYSLQTLTEMLVTGRTRGVLAVMIRSRSYPVFTWDIPRHEAAESRIIDAVSQWWSEWANATYGGAPGPEYSVPADVGGLAEIFDDGSSIDLSADNALPALLAERETLAGFALRLKKIDEEIKEKMGPARLGYLPGWRISYPTIHRKPYSVAEGDYRRLTVSKAEEG
jgi:predicted phage-related endonuclease